MEAKTVAARRDGLLQAHFSGFFDMPSPPRKIGWLNCKWQERARSREFWENQESEKWRSGYQKILGKATPEKAKNMAAAPKPAAAIAV
jgi:hypothetical protein